MLLALALFACDHSAAEFDAQAEAYAAASERLAAPEGLQAMQKVAAQAPWFALAHHAIAEAEYQRGGWLAAFVAYKRYLVAAGEAVQDRADVRLRLSEIERKLPALQEYVEGEHEAFAANWLRVKERMANVIDKKPSFAPAHRLLGIAHAALGDNDAAYAAYARYLALDPDAPDAKTVAGFLARRKGK